MQPHTAQMQLNLEKNIFNSLQESDNSTLSTRKFLSEKSFKKIRNSKINKKQSILDQADE